MLQDELPKQIELLVDSLRKDKTAQLSLGDVASVTEVLIGTTQAFFRSIDTSIYRECRALSDYISNARLEIASLQPGDLEESRIPRAGMELDAIVQQTEEATNTIMEAAEEIMGADPSDNDGYQTTVQDAVMRIFEACSFQDITGQRISKVVETLAHIEGRVLELRDLMGVTEEDISAAKSKSDTVTVSEDEKLLSGPALKGEGIDQSAVDQLMGGNSAPVEQAPSPEPTPVAEPKPEPVVAAPTPKPAPKPEPPAAPEPPKPVDPKQLDEMFEEDFDPMAEIAAGKAEAAAKAEAAEAEAVKAKDKVATAAPKKADTSVDLPEGEEVSQDDIDALFG